MRPTISSTPVGSSICSDSIAVDIGLFMGTLDSSHDTVSVEKSSVSPILFSKSLPMIMSYIPNESATCILYVMVAVGFSSVIWNCVSTIPLVLNLPAIVIQRALSGWVRKDDVYFRVISEAPAPESNRVFKKTFRSP